MKKIFFLAFVLLVSVKIQAQRSGLDRNGNFNIQPLIDDLFMNDKASLYRGVEFDMTKAEVKKLELARNTTSLYNEDSTLVITTDLGEEILDFADISYSFDDEGLYHIGVEGYITTKEKANELYDKIESYLTNKYGEGEIADDGFYEIQVEGKKYDFIIAMLNITGVEDSYGFYLYFYIN